MSVVLFIEKQHNTERHFTHGFRLGAIHSGWTPRVVWLSDANGKHKDPIQLRKEIEEAQPDIIFWLMDSMLPFAECLESDNLVNIPKISFWFDDFQRTSYIHELTEKHQRLQNQYSLMTYVWDGYWRDEFKKQFSIDSRPIHLAADDSEIFPGEPTHFKGYDDYIVFTGNTPSLNYIRELANVLPRPCQDLVERVRERIEKLAYGLLPYAALSEEIENLHPKAKVVVEHFREIPGQRILLNRLAWLLGKREVRLRILKLAAQQRPVLILSGHTDRSNAHPKEFERDLGATKHQLKFIETSHLEAHQLGALYHIRGLQIQATDPQSVRGGIPFRVFETAAAARPLLADYKPELAECFEPQKEILLYRSDLEFPEMLAVALKNKARLDEVGACAHKRFLNEHTWKHRFQKIVTETMQETKSR